MQGGSHSFMTAIPPRLSIEFPYLEGCGKLPLLCALRHSLSSSALNSSRSSLASMGVKAAGACSIFRASRLLYWDNGK